MHDSRRLVRGRLKRFRQEYLPAAIHRDRVPLRLERWDVPDEPVPFTEAVAQSYVPFEAGAGAASRWGKPWGTTWFRITGEVPSGWSGLDTGSPGGSPYSTSGSTGSPGGSPYSTSGTTDSPSGSPYSTSGTTDSGEVQIEALVDLGFNRAQPGFQAEGTAYAPDGRVIKGIEPLNAWVPLADISPDGRRIEFYLEVAANPFIAENGWFMPTPLGSKATAGEDLLYELRSVDLTQLDLPVWELAQDVTVLAGYLDELPEDSPRFAQILHSFDRMFDAVDPRSLSTTAAAGREALAPVLASPAVPSAHEVIATGHAHIDSAWLWPTRETVRKCARTFSNVLGLMDEDPELVFACSSAQQYEWVRETYPDLFERIKAKVAAGQFVPVGGMWVESDTNLPGGEALARQLIEGKRFFLEHFGLDTQEVWLPDSFGYSAALPQLVTASGSRWFLTQKISWNDTNTMPHHTFHWEGIDGTRVFTHFPPVDTYTSDLSARELLRAERQFREKGRTNISLVPFGWGDGGGGPTREMTAAARRQRDLEGAPRVRIASPQTFFERAEEDYPEPPVWSGELYLEYHRGTYTSQARTKRGNRRSEHLLREAELWATAAAVRAGRPYPHNELRRIWRVVLLCQFHDILPGSSISWVHEDAERDYAQVERELEQVVADSVSSLVGDGDSPVILNAGPYEQDGVPALGGNLNAVETAPRTATLEEGGAVLENAFLRVWVDRSGEMTSIRDLVADREVVPTGMAAGAFQLFEDIPNEWDAWDVNEHYRRNELDVEGSRYASASAPATRPSDEPTRPMDEAARTADEAARPAVAVEGDSVVVTRQVASSTVRQRISLSADGRSIDLELDVDWHERQRLLKLAFPLDVQAERATAEIQFGHVHRPIHQNTSWDAARFETCAHRWMHVGEPDYGVAISNDATYGHDVQRIPTADGIATLVRLSLLRAPQFPDPDADAGTHSFRVRITPAADVGAAVREGYRLNVPLREVRGARPPEPLVQVDDPRVTVEAVKLADDGSGDVVLRAYESAGGRARTTIRTTFEHSGVIETDLLEREVAPRAVLSQDASGCEINLRPFQIVTLRFRR